MTHCLDSAELSANETESLCTSLQQQSSFGSEASRIMRYISSPLWRRHCCADFFASEWLGGCSMSSLTKSFLDIFRNFLPREYPSTNNLVIFLRFYYVRLHDRLPVDSSERFLSFLGLVHSAALMDYEFPVSLLESHPVSGREATTPFPPYRFCFCAQHSHHHRAVLCSYWGLFGIWKLVWC